MLTFGLTLLGSIPPGRLVALARRAEAAGFREIWVPDIVLRGRDVVPLLTLLASETGLRFGPGVMHPFTRHLAVSVNAIRTLEEIAPGRAMLGLGSGGAGLPEVGAPVARLADLEAAVLLARRLLAGERVDATAPPATLVGAQLRFPPARIPIWLAATGPRALRLAGEVADCALIHVGAAPATVRFALDRLAEGRARVLGTSDRWTVEASERPSAGGDPEHRPATLDAGSSLRVSLYAYASTADDASTSMAECRSGVASLLARHPAYASLAGSELGLPAATPTQRLTAALIDPVLDAGTVRRLAITGGASEWEDRVGQLREAGLMGITLVAVTREAELIDRAADLIARFG